LRCNNIRYLIIHIFLAVKKTYFIGSVPVIFFSGCCRCLPNPKTGTTIVFRFLEKGTSLLQVSEDSEMKIFVQDRGMRKILPQAYS
jgi:hypothetical protein